jgi:hypothetical protein
MYSQQSRSRSPALPARALGAYQRHPRMRMRILRQSRTNRVRMVSIVAGTHGRTWHAACILSQDTGLAGNFR